MNKSYMERRRQENKRLLQEAILGIMFMAVAFAVMIISLKLWG